MPVGLKKTKSNDALSRLNNTPPANSTDSGYYGGVLIALSRCINLFFIVCGFIFYSSVEHEILSSLGLYPLVITAAAFQFIMFFVTIFILSMRYVRSLNQRLSNDQQWFVKTSFDGVSTAIFLVIATVSTTRVDCSRFVVNYYGCNRYMYGSYCVVISTILFALGLGHDVLAYYKKKKASKNGGESIELNQTSRSSNL